MQTRTVTEATLGAWVFKVDGRGFDESTSVESRCVAANYRKDLMRTGQRALLWVSGPADGPRPRGIWGVGWITGESRLDPEDGWVAQTDITLLTRADRVLAADIRGIPGLEHMEVVRMPQGSNPSWVSNPELALIEPLLPEWPTMTPTT